MFYVFLVLVGIAGIGVYVLFIFNLVPGVQDERLGVLEPLPPDVGRWSADTESAAGQAAARDRQVREVRHFFYESSGKLVLQVRYKQKDTGEIVRVEPEQAVKRKRVRV
ncbi:MAG TPA: hypothetical protein VMI54_00255 [Polyangiaceae bacterium]|nr:hypothetical protein [Polyangiaceae bacterium]